MQNERWIADRALLGRSLGFVNKWVKRIRCAPSGDSTVLFGLPRGHKTASAPIDPLVEERILAIRDEPPENLKRVPGPKAILYYLPRDPAFQQRQATLPRSTRTLLILLASSNMWSTF